MLAALRCTAPGLALCICCAFPSLAQHRAPGSVASAQARHIASTYPGRMTGTETEKQTALYIHQQFMNWGYQSTVHPFPIQDDRSDAPDHGNKRALTGNMVSAERPGSAPQQIIVMAHLDTWAARSEGDNKNLGGPLLQGIDDNASGVGVMLELADRLRKSHTQYGIRFIATSGEEQKMAGARNILQNMSEQEKKNTLLVVNIDSLVTGDKLYFNSGNATPPAVRTLTRDKAIKIAHHLGIAATTNPGLNPQYPKGTGCCNDAEVFDRAGIPVLSVEATNWMLGRKDGYQQRAKSPAFPEGTSWHNVRYDSVQHMDRWLPGRIEARSRDTVRILLPLLKTLAKAR